MSGAEESEVETLPAEAPQQVPGGAAALGWGCLILLGSSVAGTVAAALLLLLLTGGRSPDFHAASLYSEYESLPRIWQATMDVGFDSNGTYLSLFILFAAPVAFLLTAAVVSGYRASPRSFLGLRRPTVRQVVLWTSASLAVDYGLEALFRRAGLEVGGNLTLDLYRTALVVPLLYLGIVVAGPVFEEILFRGLLLEAWRSTRLGAVGAAALTSALWAISHPYPAAEVFIIFCGGLLLAAARLRTGSTLLAILMHGCLNLAVLIQVGLFLAHHGTEHFLDRGREHLKREQYWEAFLAFREAERQAEGPCAECQLGLARVYLADHEPERAAETARKLIQTRPSADLLAQASDLLHRALLAQGFQEVPRG